MLRDTTPTTQKTHPAYAHQSAHPLRRRHPAGASSSAEPTEDLSARMESMGSPLLGLADRAPLLTPESEAADDPGQASRPSRMKRWASSVGKFFTPPVLGAPAAAAAMPSPTASPDHGHSRPADPRHQHFHELIDSIGKAPDGHRFAIANAMADRLRRAGLQLPTRQNPTGMTIQLLQSPQWFDALGDQRLNISDLLGALKHSEQTDPALQPELRRRLMTAFELTVHRLAETHKGISALRASCAVAMRPLPDQVTRTLGTAVRMAAFRTGIAELVHRPESRTATPGQLATRLFECLRDSRNIVGEQGLELMGQITPAIEALIHEDAAARQMAGPLREAAHRLEAYLYVSTASDMPSPTERQPGSGGIESMSPQHARGFVLDRLMISALDPGAVDAQLQRGEVRGWMHSAVADFPERQNSARAALQVLRQTLRTLRASGLIDDQQTAALMQQAKAHLRSASVPTT